MKRKALSKEAARNLLNSFPQDSFTYCCDLAKESVDLLCQLGFAVTGHQPPKSIWIKGNGVEISECFDDDKMKSSSWHRIYDCGAIELQWNR